MQAAGSKLVTSMPLSDNPSLSREPPHLRHTMSCSCLSNAVPCSMQSLDSCNHLPAAVAFRMQSLADCCCNRWWLLCHTRLPTRRIAAAPASSATGMQQQGWSSPPLQLHGAQGGECSSAGPATTACAQPPSYTSAKLTHSDACLHTLELYHQLACPAVLYRIHMLVPRYSSLIRSQPPRTKQPR